MLTRNNDRTLVHKYWIKTNQKMCVDWLDGNCDVLGRHPEQYPKVTKMVTAYEFLYPIIVFFLWGFIIHQFILTSLISVFAVVYLPFLPLIIGYSTILITILVIIGVSVELLYYFYLYKKIGIYVVIPIIALFFQTILGFVPFVGVLLSIFIGLVPWSIMAVGTHFVHYQVGIGVMFSVDDNAYVQKKEEENFYLEW